MAKAPAIKPPRTTDQAIAQLERFAVLDGERTSIETNRNAAIAATNAVADTLAAPIVAELEQLQAAIATWWSHAGKGMLPADRKSMELGGCMIGTKLGNKALAFAGGDDKAALAVLSPLAWAKKLIRRTPAIDKTAIRKALTGKRKDDLAQLGFSEEQAETFILERTAQSGTISS